VVPGAGKVEIVYTPADGSEGQRHELFDFDGSGIAMGMYNTDKVRYAICLPDTCVDVNISSPSCEVYGFWCGTTLKWLWLKMMTCCGPVYTMFLSCS